MSETNYQYTGRSRIWMEAIHVIMWVLLVSFAIMVISTLLKLLNKQAIRSAAGKRIRNEEYKGPNKRIRSRTPPRKGKTYARKRRNYMVAK